MTEMKLRDPLKKFVEFIDGPDASGQQALLQGLGRTAVIVRGYTSPQSAVNSGLRGPTWK